MSEHDADYGLVLPFVVCASQGGPFDDESFVAGFQCGALDAHLAGLGKHGVVTLRSTVRTETLPQLDLIAMRHGLTMTTEPWDEEQQGEEWASEWATAVFTNESVSE